jgi:hypothetical protein
VRASLCQPVSTRGRAVLERQQRNTQPAPVHRQACPAHGRALAVVRFPPISRCVAPPALSAPPASAVRPGVAAHAAVSKLIRVSRCAGVPAEGVVHKTRLTVAVRHALACVYATARRICSVAQRDAGRRQWHAHAQGHNMRQAGIVVRTSAERTSLLPQARRTPAHSTCPWRRSAIHCERAGASERVPSSNRQGAALLRAYRLLASLRMLAALLLALHLPARSHCASTRGCVSVKCATSANNTRRVMAQEQSTHGGCVVQQAA